MVTQKANRVAYTKALVALAAGACCFLIYVLACVFSPVTWSPDCSKIAILVTPPLEVEYKEPVPDKFAIFTYDIATGQRVLLDEVEKNGVLSAPSWSPDGKWIAYYRVEPNIPQAVGAMTKADPNVSLLAAEPNRDTNQPAPPIESKLAAEDLFNEENRMLPPMLFEMVKEKLSGKEDLKTVDVKLMLIRPDGTEKKILQIIKSECDQDDKHDSAFQSLMYMRPEWSRDCKRIFYVRILDSTESYFMASLDIETGKTWAHLLGGFGTPVVSPDGKWVISLREPDPSKKAVLTVAKTDGNLHKYFQLDIDFDDSPIFFTLVPLSWVPDSKRILIWDKKGFRIMNPDTGEMEQLGDPNATEIAYPAFSTAGDRLYYIAKYKTGDPNSANQQIYLKSMGLKDKKIRTEFTLSNVPNPNKDKGQMPADKDEYMFFVSPNGKLVVMRGVVKDAEGNDKSALIIWDGKTRKVVETDRWLMKPLYTNDNLTFEEKLVGKWKAKDGEMLVCERKPEKAYYKMVRTGKDGKERHYWANLANVKGIRLLGMFLDESLLYKKDRYGSHLLPDAFMKIEQIEPKLLLRGMDYDKVAEILKRDPNLPEEKTMEGEDIAEFEKISAEQ
jgi:dipeptidyl aminopeptidase/acylaminoacyl peptidase